MNRQIISQNRESRGNEFQTIRAEIAVRMNIVVHITPIKEPGGVQSGKFIVLYQSIPPAVSQLPKTAMKIAVIGIKK